MSTLRQLRMRLAALFVGLVATGGAIAVVPCDKNHYILEWNCGQKAGPANHLVGIGDDCDPISFGTLCFYPTPLTIRAGDSVTFYPYDSNWFNGPRNVVADDGSFRCASGCDGEGGDGAPRSVWQFTRTFQTPGVVAYHDEVHLVRGVIEVLANDGTTPAPAAIEYRRNSHYASPYFVTSFPEEIAALDHGGLWWRTGESFNVWSAPTGGTLPTCRFVDKVYGGHFYTPYPAECASVQARDGWLYEGTAFHLQVPDLNGNCPADTTVLFRLYNDSTRPDLERYLSVHAPLHRYTTRVDLFNQLRAKGWLFEGDSRTFAFACVPSIAAATSP